MSAPPTNVPPQNLVGGPQNPVGGPQNPVGGPQNLVGAPQNTVGPPQYPVGGPQNPVGGPQNPVGGPQNLVGGPQNPFGGSQNPVGPPQNLVGGPQNPVGPPQNLVGGPQNPVGGPQNPVGPPQNTGVGAIVPPVLPANDPRVQRLNQILVKHEINPNLAPKILTLMKFEIVVVCDDSGSMEEKTPQGPQATRWDELKSIANVVIDIASALDTNGADIHFLHRPPLLNLKDSQPIPAAFAAPPSGATPIVPVLRKIIDDKRAQAREKKLLILVATDGVPTNEFDDPDPAALADLLANGRTKDIYVEFLACTDSRKDMEYLNEWDKRFERVDVVDDFRSEEAEVKRLRPNMPFSYGDYIVKALLGSTDAALDFADERA